MDIFNLFKSFIFGIIQGITEWLPISSTGHLIIAEDLWHLNLSKEFIEIFFVVIQVGSVLAVLVLFFKDLNPFSKFKNKEEQKQTINLWFKIAVATLPAVIIGFFFNDTIDNLLYNSITVSLMLIIYGVIFIIMEKQNRKPKVSNLYNISYKTALGIGFFQMLALIPGTSRSGATIIGAVMLGTSRYIASEFSFFLAIPTIIGASGYKLIKANMAFTNQEWLVLIIGAVTAFIVSIFAIKYLLDYIRKHDFKIFGYYRIILGIIVLLYFGSKLIF